MTEKPERTEELVLADPGGVETCESIAASGHGACCS